MLAFLMDVIDGWIARKRGITLRGQLIDRISDRVSQVVAPVLLYIIKYGFSKAFTLYASALLIASVWRLVKAPVADLRAFPGLPLICHTAVIIASIIGGFKLPPLIMLVLIIPTLLPVPYPRGSINEATAPVKVMALLTMMIIPYDIELLKTIMLIVIYGVVTYTCVGWLPSIIRSQLRSR